MIEKTFGKDFDSEGGALTLRQSDVTEGKEEHGHHSRTHDSGWTISGELHEDYFVWVNEFEAVHPQLGRVWGNFEDKVFGDSEEAFAHFYGHHAPEAWDYWEI